MNNKLPALKSDKAAEKLLDKDLSAYISAENLAPFPFEYKPKQESVMTGVVRFARHGDRNRLRCANLSEVLRRRRVAPRSG